MRECLLKEEVIVIDAGTSEVGGKLMGDVDAASCQDKSGWLAPVPGGVGPLTVAHIFKNLATLTGNG